MKYEVSCTFCGHSQIYNPRGGKIPRKPHTDCKGCGKDFTINIEISENIPRIPKITKSALLKKKPHSHPESPTNDTFIDNPNELLMSNAIRALNKQEPDVKWGNLLYNILKETKQLQAPSKERSEVKSQLKQYSTTDLISLRKKLTGNLQEGG